MRTAPRRLRVPPRAAALVALAVLLPLGEVVGLRLAGLASYQAVSAQVAAPPPFGVFHDLRWVLVYNHSWPGFVAELAAAVVFRAVLNTALAALAWPGDVPRPPLPALLRSATLYTLAAVVLLAPAVTLTLAAAATSLSWFLFSGLLPLALLALVLNRGGIAPGWWRRPPTPASVAIAVLTFVALTAASTATAAAPGWWSLLGVAGGGVADALLWSWLVRSVARTRARTIPAYVTPVAVALIPALYLAFGTQVIGHAQAGPTPVTRSDDRLTAPGGHQVLYVNGYDSTYQAPITGYPKDIRITAFSYRGQYPDGAPLPYGPNATHQSLGVLAHRLAQQVDDLHRRTHQRIEIVAESEGTFIVRTYLQQRHDPPVGTVVLLSPLIRPARVYFPPHTEDQGWGLAGGWALRALTALSRLKTGSTVTADEPFIHSILAHGPRYRATMMCPIDNVHLLAIVPSASASVVPPGHVFAVPTRVESGLHGSLHGYGDVHRDLVAVLRGAPVPTRVPATYHLLQDAGAGWQAPPLPQSFVAAWHTPGGQDPVLDGAAPCHPRG